MLKCKMFNLFSQGATIDDQAVNSWLATQPEGMDIVSITQSSCVGTALGMGDGVRTVLTIFYR